jgi:hypothetical protein
MDSDGLGTALAAGTANYYIGWLAQIVAVVIVIAIAIAYASSLRQSGPTLAPPQAPQLVSTPPRGTKPRPQYYAVVAAVSLLAAVLGLVIGIVLWGAVVLGLGTAVAGLAGARLLDWLEGEAPATTEHQISVPIPATIDPPPEELQAPESGTRIISAGFVVMVGVIGGKLAYDLGQRLLWRLVRDSTLDTTGGAILGVLIWIAVCTCVVAWAAFSATVGAALHRNLMHRARSEYVNGY